MEYVWSFLRCLVDVAGPPDQPAFLAPVSPTGFEFAASVRDRENGNLERSVRALGSLDHGTACDEHDQQHHEEKISGEKHGCLLKPRLPDEGVRNSICVQIEQYNTVLRGAQADCLPGVVTHGYIVTHPAG